ncbi:class III signal peptide [archaeon BMS3Abin16]|nr:class III signal peptide [archaeon BMS3Abin16]HDZ61525.1 class III signal peptide-containing protein [Nitrospirota bacterium]
MGFFDEDRGQAAIEYILIVGGVIVAAVVVGVIYSETVKNTGETFLRSVNNITNTTKNRVLEILKKT